LIPRTLGTIASTLTITPSRRPVSRCSVVSGGGCCEHGNEPSGFTKGRTFLDQPSPREASRNRFISIQLVISWFCYQVMTTCFFVYSTITIAVHVLWNDSN
jgi:hypothetical protein